MIRRLQVRLLADGRRLHLQDGPIDLICEAFGPQAALRTAYAAAEAAAEGLLDRLCAELPALRHPAGASTPPLHDPVAIRMGAAVAPYAAETFITPMAAVAGAVAEAVLAAMVSAGDLDRAYVNNGGDIALHCAPGRHFTIGLIDRPDRPSLFGRVRIGDGDGDGVGGIATSGWRGRSFSFGIADSVTVLAASAATADAAATIVANAVDLPSHPAIRRMPAAEIQPDSDLGMRLVTRHVDTLPSEDIARALAAGRLRAQDLLRRGLIQGAALQLQGHVETIGSSRLVGTRERDRVMLVPLRSKEEAVHA